MLNIFELNNVNKYSSGIYCITNTVDDRIYIGSTQNFHRRFYEHKRDLRLNLHANPHLQNFFNKYGETALIFGILIETNLEDLLIIEQEYLDKYNPAFNCAKIAGKPPVLNRGFNEKMINYISELYNSGKTCCQISEIIYGSKIHRAKINLLVSGRQYKEFSHLFNYKKFSQLGKKRERFKKFSTDQKIFIKETHKYLSSRKLSIKLGLPKSTIINYIETIK